MKLRVIDIIIIAAVILLLEEGIILKGQLEQLTIQSQGYALRQEKLIEIEQWRGFYPREGVND